MRFDFTLAIREASERTGVFVGLILEDHGEAIESALQDAARNSRDLTDAAISFVEENY